MILATDLDRTLIPNGNEPYDGDLQEFFRTVREADMELWYVTGRNLEEFHQAKTRYDLEVPTYLCAEVGTVIYERVSHELRFMEPWREHILSKNSGWSREKVLEAVDPGRHEGVELQEPEHQNEFKISLYVSEHDRANELMNSIKAACAEYGLEPELVWSFDPLKDDIGLLDVLAGGATKTGAVEFLRQHTGHTHDDVIYAGDSGNDILPLTSGYRAIVVHNAPDEVKNTVRESAVADGVEDRIYIAARGSYADGILEGLREFGVID